MIKYKLHCKNCDKKFDSWFLSSCEFDKLKKKKILTCYTCNSSNVEKTLMSPNLKNTKKKEKFNIKKLNKLNKLIRKNQNYIKKNFEYVGEKFAYEARLIHYDKKSKKKGIYGKAKINEIRELNDEGIQTEVVPWINKKDN
ncbi:MAG: hypothetical protein CMI86_00125 [Candidatus Pelagibacter sp.]|nr:hypothetical protein [Candidatus Pelagibacter sp.]|tara:strand:+ start:31084 stop:31506 length:423 start_codon:yes stop_codon:yes gene_type:complete